MEEFPILFEKKETKYKIKIERRISYFSKTPFYSCFIQRPSHTCILHIDKELCIIEEKKYSTIFFLDITIYLKNVLKLHIYEI